MKKILLTLGLAAICVSSFAQGNFIFQTASGTVWDNWTGTGIRRDASNNVAFLFTSNLGAVASFGTGIATNVGTGFFSSSPWTSILTDPNFKLATNSATGTAAIVQSSTLGAASYLSGAAFTVAGTSASGGTVQIILLAWDYRYATPDLAAQAGAAVGWSSAFNYNYVAGPVPGPAGNAVNMNGLYTPFGVSSIGAVPEPSTLVLAGLGGLSLLAFRRKK